MSGDVTMTRKEWEEVRAVVALSITTYSVRGAVLLTRQSENALNTMEIARTRTEIRGDHGPGGNPNAFNKWS